MSESYLILAPFLMLGIVALLGFVGCDALLHLDPVPPAIPGPTNLIATPGDGRVDLTWDPYPAATEFYVKRTIMSGVYLDQGTSLSAPDHTYADMTVTNGTTYYYVVSARVSGRETLNSDETPPITPTSSPSGYFVTGMTPGSLNNQYHGWVGMEILVGPNTLTITELGRLVAPNNFMQHAMRIIDKTSGIVLNTDILETTGGTPGQFSYVTLATPVTVIKDASYYVLSSEMTGGDYVYQDDSTIQHTSVATVVSAIKGDEVTPYVPSGSTDNTFGPLDFHYTVVP